MSSNKESPWLEVFLPVVMAGIVITMVVSGLWLCSWGYRKYSIWSEGMRGQAELAHAEWNRQIAVTEAIAKKDSALHLSDAEIIRARGVAEANQIIGESLKKNEQYLRYLWIQTLDHSQNKIIYVPTEANLPILEAGRKE
jgi:hypothetical protein